MGNKYLFNRDANCGIARGEEFSLEWIAASIRKFDQTMHQVSNFDVNISEILGMRNLSSFVGEVFAASLIATSEGKFVKNPHQDGYPDLLLMDDFGKRKYAELIDRLREKDPFSPFPSGGIEVKATVGTVPSPQYFAKRGRTKPDIGEQRIEFLRSYDWKAHHRDTNNLLGIVWDFIEKKPTICGVFYQPDLTITHWGAIVKPKEDGGRTTSISIMTREGVRLMYQNWIAVADDQRYIEFFNDYNSGTLMRKTP